MVFDISLWVVYKVNFFGLMQLKFLKKIVDILFYKVAFLKYGYKSLFCIIFDFWIHVFVTFLYLDHKGNHWNVKLWLVVHWFDRFKSRTIYTWYLYVEVQVGFDQDLIIHLIDAFDYFLVLFDALVVWHYYSGGIFVSFCGAEQTFKLWHDYSYFCDLGTFYL